MKSFSKPWKAAKAMGINCGVIEEGKLCDLVVLDVNPLEEAALRKLSQKNVFAVYIGGNEAYQSTCQCQRGPL